MDVQQACGQERGQEELKSCKGISIALGGGDGERWSRAVDSFETRPCEREGAVDFVFYVRFAIWRATKYPWMAH